MPHAAFALPRWLLIGDALLSANRGGALLISARRSCASWSCGASQRCGAGCTPARSPRLGKAAGSPRAADLSHRISPHTTAHQTPTDLSLKLSLTSLLGEPKSTRTLGLSLSLVYPARLLLPCALALSTLSCLRSTGSPLSGLRSRLVSKSTCTAGARLFMSRIPASGVP